MGPAMRETVKKSCSLIILEVYAAFKRSNTIYHRYIHSTVGNTRTTLANMFLTHGLRYATLTASSQQPRLGHGAHAALSRKSASDQRGTRGALSV